jgi:hypothetical protein
MMYFLNSRIETELPNTAILELNAWTSKVDRSFYGISQMSVVAGLELEQETF